MSVSHALANTHVRSFFVVYISTGTKELLVRPMSAYELDIHAIKYKFHIRGLESYLDRFL